MLALSLPPNLPPMGNRPRAGKGLLALCAALCTKTPVPFEVGALGRQPTGQKYRGCPVLWFSEVSHDSATFGVRRHSRRAYCGVTQNRGGHGGVRDPPALALGHGSGLLVIGGSLWSHKKRGYSMEPKTLTTARCSEIPRNLSFTNQSCRLGAASPGPSLKHSK